MRTNRNNVTGRPEGGAYYVALGSSFAAGPGLGPRAPGSPRIAMRTVHGYPQQLARLLAPSSFSDMSASGSTLVHVLHGGPLWLGAQVDALGPATRLVTLTAGGNDVDYVGDLLYFAYRNRGGLRGAALRVLRKAPLAPEARAFDVLERRLRDTLAAVRERAPLAQLVVATYPRVLPERGSCDAAGLTAPQADLMRAVAERLAWVTRTVSEACGATVVDMHALSEGHDACSPAPWVSGFRPPSGMSFHPTRAGAAATAQAIAQSCFTQSTK